MQPKPAFSPLSVPSEGTLEVAVSRSQPTKTETLGDYVRRLRGDRSLSEIEGNSARKGKRVAASYINRIENGVILRPSVERLTAIANGLGAPVQELLAIAFGKPMQKSDARVERLVKGFQSLPDDVQEDLLEMISALDKKYARRRAA